MGRKLARLARRKAFNKYLRRARFVSPTGRMAFVGVEMPSWPHPMKHTMTVGFGGRLVENRIQATDFSEIETRLINGMKEAGYTYDEATRVWTSPDGKTQVGY